MDESVALPQGDVKPVVPPAQSALSSLVGIFVKPRGTFEALVSRPRILIPILVMVVAQLVLGVAMTGSGAVKNDAIAKYEAKGMPPEQIEAVERSMDRPAVKVIIPLSMGVVAVFMLAVSAGLLYFMGNLMLGARATYRDYLCVSGYAALIGLVDQAVQVAMAASRGTMHVSLGLGAFFGDDPGLAIRLLDSVTNPLSLWSTAIAALGVAVFTRKNFGFGVICVLPSFLLGVVLRSLNQ